MSKPIIWTSIAAVLVSSFSLAASGWVIANDGGRHAPIAESPVHSTTVHSTTVHSKALHSTTHRNLASDGQDLLDTSAKAATTATPVVDERNEKKTSPSHAAADLVVKRLVVASGVEAREPVGANDTFQAGDHRVYAFVELANRSSHEGDIIIAFERGSTRRGMVELEVPATTGHWRTWGFTRGLRQAGTWQVVVREQVSGKELARTAIEITDEKPMGTSPAVAPAVAPSENAAEDTVKGAKGAPSGTHAVADSVVANAGVDTMI